MFRGLADGIDSIVRHIGQTVAWLTLGMTLTTFGVVVLRYGLEIGSIALQESVLYMHASVFLLGAAYTLQTDGHVRVDILYRAMGPAGKAWINLLGTLFLLMPVCSFLIWIGWDYTLQAWRIREGSQEAGGLAYVWLLKTLVPLSMGLLILQGIAEIVRAILIVAGKPPVVQTGPRA